MLFWLIASALGAFIPSHVLDAQERRYHPSKCKRAPKAKKCSTTRRGAVNKNPPGNNKNKIRQKEMYILLPCLN